MRDWTFDANTLKSIPFEGYDFWHPPEFANWANALAGGTYEPEIMTCLCERLRPEMVFFDIGAHFGSYTLPGARRAKQVFAFEPALQNFGVLEQNVRRNHLDNVVIVANPLFSSAVSGQLNKKDRFVPGEGDITSSTLDSLDAVPDVIKMDVDGAEADILLGGTNMLSAHKPLILLELHPRLLSRYHRTPEAVKRTLQRCGYQAIVCLGKKKHSDVSYWKFEAT